MGEIYLYDQVAANNNAAPPDGWPENMPYPDVNDCAREMMAAEARDLADRNGTLLSSGTAPDYVLTSTRSIPALTDGLILGFRCHADNGAAVTTLNVNTLGGLVVVLPDGSVPTLLANSVYQVVYDAAQTRWQLLSVTTPEDALPTIQVKSAPYTLSAADFKDVITRIAGTGVTVDAPVAALGLTGMARFLIEAASPSFTLTNNTGQPIYRSDSSTPIPVTSPLATSVVLTGPAYTLIPGAFGLVLVDFIA